MSNLPAKFLEEMQTLLPENEYRAFLESYERPYHNGLRVNTSKISVEAFKKLVPWELSPVPWIENGFYYPSDLSPAKHPYYYAGLYYLQEPSAMTPANRLPVLPGERVLDLCAAPGGKSTELAAKLSGQGLLVSNDISASRAKGLLKNLELFGVDNFVLTVEDPSGLAEAFPAYFDKILVDAPCSGEGMFRKDHKMIPAWERQGPDFYGKIQRSIVKDAVKMLRPGGMLMYSTCTFSEWEDEAVIRELLEVCPSLTPVQIRPYEGFDPGLGVRIWPHRMDGEGHYLCLLAKDACDSASGHNETTLPAGRKSVKGAIRGTRRPELPEELSAFLQQIKRYYDPERIFLRGPFAYYLPDAPMDLSGLRYLRTGLFLGELKKKRFEPSQALAMSLKQGEFFQEADFSCDDPLVLKYLKGETIPADFQSGYVLITVDGFPLGFGKAQNGLIKNKYLPGWRVNWT